jgi:hypothetical protein
MTIRPTNLYSIDSPAFGGPFGLNATLFDNVLAAEFEGLWTPMFGIKQASLEIAGKLDSLSCQIYGTNSKLPLNGYIVTAAGSPAAGDIPTITFDSSNLSGDAVAIAYTAISGDTATTIAVALVALINASIPLASIGVRASNVAGVITINWPSNLPESVFGVGAGNPAMPPESNAITLVPTVGGSGPGTTLALTLPTTGVALGSAITALGLATIGTVIPRYIKARVTTLTGTGANVTGNLQGSA